MLAPSIYNDFISNFFNGFGDMFNMTSTYDKALACNISTDVKEYSDHYELDMELPGYKKEDIQIELRDGYLAVSAKHSEEESKQDDDGKCIYKERKYGQCKRSFYVGKSITKDQIHAGFENGILKLNIPKEEQVQKVEQTNYIPIE